MQTCEGHQEADCHESDVKGEHIIWQHCNFLQDSSDHVDREKPNAEVNPADYHNGIGKDLNCDRSNVDMKLEKGNCEVSYIMNQHHCRPYWHEVKEKRNDYKGFCQQVMEKVLFEISSISLPEADLYQIYQMINEFIGVKILQVGW